MDAVTGLFEEIVNPKLYVRRVYVTANNLISDDEAEDRQGYRQMSLFEDLEMKLRTDRGNLRTRHVRRICSRR